MTVNWGSPRLTFFPFLSELIPLLVSLSVSDVSVDIEDWMFSLLVAVVTDVVWSEIFPLIFVLHAVFTIRLILTTKVILRLKQPKLLLVWQCFVFEGLSSLAVNDDVVFKGRNWMFSIMRSHGVGERVYRFLQSCQVVDVKNRMWALFEREEKETEVGRKRVRSGIGDQEGQPLKRQTLILVILSDILYKHLVKRGDKLWRYLRKREGLLIENFSRRRPVFIWLSSSCPLTQ